jgi:hypothetical protein
VARWIACLASATLLLAMMPAPGLAQTGPTKAEYIAEVDPICQSYLAPQRTALQNYHRLYKRWIRAASKGSLKSFIRLTHRTASALRVFDRVHSALTEQVAAISPPDSDAGLIGIWLNARRQADALGDAAARALDRFKAGRYFKLARRADNTEAYGVQAIGVYGFQVCGISA